MWVRGLVIVLGLVTGACLFGQGCPGSGPPLIGAATILDETTRCTVEIDGFCRVRRVFTPTQPNRNISIEVTASLTNSRTQFGVDDGNGNNVLNVTDATSNVSSGSFINQNTTQHVLVVRENVNPTSEYRIVVRQR